MTGALGESTWPEVADRGPSVLAVPLGSVEQHGPHLPLDTDTRIAVALVAALAAARPDVVAAPPLAYGASGEHAGFPGTLSIGTEALTTVLVELGRSADAFAGVVFVNGHGGNLEAVRARRRPAHRRGPAGRSPGRRRCRAATPTPGAPRPRSCSPSTPAACASTGPSPAPPRPSPT